MNRPGRFVIASGRRSQGLRRGPGRLRRGRRCWRGRRRLRRGQGRFGVGRGRLRGCGRLRECWRLGGGRGGRHRGRCHRIGEPRRRGAAEHQRRGDHDRQDAGSSNVHGLSPRSAQRCLSARQGRPPAVRGNGRLQLEHTRGGPAPQRRWTPTNWSQTRDSPSTTTAVGRPAREHLAATRAPRRPAECGPSAVVPLAPARPASQPAEVRPRTPARASTRRAGAGLPISPAAGRSRLEGRGHRASWTRSGRSSRPRCTGQCVRLRAPSG